MLTVRHLSFTMGKKEILNDICLDFGQDKFTAILGPNGSGKSTLLSFLSKERQSHGAVQFAGQSLDDIPARAYAQRVAMLPQQREHMANFHAEDVVVMGRYPFKKQFHDYTARDYEIARQAMMMTGTDSLRKRRLSSMSGGEIQRTMIAKVFAQQPELILMDEPTNHLDVKYKLALMQTLKNYGHTIIVVLHDLSLALQFTDEVILMKEGKIYAHGMTPEVMQTNVLENLFGVPFVRYEQNGKIYLNY